MRVLHFSDVHLESGFAGVGVTRFANKRFVGFVNLALRRRRKYRGAPQKMGALAKFMNEQSVDLAICTGDYTALGTLPEHKFAREMIEPFVNAPKGFVTVPGNHDVYLPDALPDFEEVFGTLLSSDCPDLATDGIWPLVRLVDDDVAVVAINSARPNPPIFRSSGRIPDAQIQGLDEALADPRLVGRFVFVITHYAPRLWNGEPDSPSHGLENADELLQTCAKIKRGALLHGHVHRGYSVRVPEMAIPIFGAGSATMEGRESIWLFDLGTATATMGAYQDGRYQLDVARVPLP